MSIFAFCMEGLSILIPTYNYCCVQLVRDLQEQASATALDFEIIVADDGSTDDSIRLRNMAIQEIPNCHYIIRQRNCGRSAIRNFLARQAIYPWLLFIDSDMMICRPDFIKTYWVNKENVVDGGIVVNGSNEHLLRYLYERASEQEHTVEKRRKSPYHDFHTANFMIPRELMLRFPFDERYSHYGYEDVAFGITLKNNSIDILHIDNPMSFEVFESNEDFILKTEEGLRTLYAFRHELKGYSRLLQAVNSLHRPVVWLISLWHQLFGTWERCQLMGNHPRLILFNIYKLGYYLTYVKKQSSSTSL